MSAANKDQQEKGEFKVANIHAQRVGQQRWKKARAQSDLIAGGYFVTAQSASGNSKETSFCGGRSGFEYCVPKIQHNDQYYSLRQQRTK